MADSIGLDQQAPTERIAATVFRWLGAAVALIWLLLAVTGILLTYHFEINDRFVSSAETPKDFAAIEQRMNALEADGGAAKVNWIWTTAGLKDRFFINYTAADGSSRNVRVAGDGSVLLDTGGNQRTALEWVREIHLSLASGAVGEWILAISGIVLLGALIRGLYKMWPRGERWGDVFSPRRGAPGERLERWYRAIGLVGAVPAFVIVGAAVVIFFEHSIEGPIGAPPINLPAVAPEGEGAGFAAAARAAEAAIPGSRFVGTTMPTREDATYRAWVNQPGEYFRENGYGGSLVMINANDASVRGAWPLQKASAAYKFMALPYPVHTGEIVGPVGRVLVMLTGFWLLTMTVIGLILWNRRRKAAAA